jgi:Cu(I)/Ag(I) efflux system membrane protein CusA/SilA
MTDLYGEPSAEQRSPVGRLIRFCLTHKLIVVLLVAFVIAWGLRVAPFDWELGGLPRDPVPTDAIPDIGENQQIVFADWPGRSPQDVEDQITQPLTAALMGTPGVKTVRGTSMFGFSTVFVIFQDGVDFYWSRSRLLEKLNSLPADALPEGVRPALGPDATALGQIFWYTLEGRDAQGQPAGGWDLEELRTIQDWQVRYALLSAEGVSEVASGGGFVREYQVDVDPDAMRAYGVTLMEVFGAVKGANIDVGADTLETNRVEYFIRGVGFIKSTADIENSVVKVNENVPIRVAQVAHVALGPAPRRGALDKAGAEAVGGVVVARFGSNPLAVIKNVKAKIAEIAPSLPTKAVIDHSKVNDQEVRRVAEENGFAAYAGSGQLNHEGWLNFLRTRPRESRPEWLHTSRVTIVPAYDRTGLIYETLGTLNDAIGQEILITAIVVILMIVNLRSSVLIGGMMPLAVLMCFIAMKTFGVDANIVALSGIVIAIGTIVDMGIVLCENILRRLEEAPPDVPRLEVVHHAASEVGSAVLTAVATTVVGFLPVFAMTGPEGKLFKPLAFTKTFALIASIIIALTVIPPLAHVMFCGQISSKKIRAFMYRLLMAGMAALAVFGLARGSALTVLAALAGAGFVAYGWGRHRLPDRLRKAAPLLANAAVVLLVGMLLTKDWEPLGPQRGAIRNFLFVAMLVGGLMVLFRLFQDFYPRILGWCLAHKVKFLLIPSAVMVLGAFIWLGFPTIMGWLPAGAGKLGIPPKAIRSTTLWVGGSRAMPGLGREFMPPLDEGSFLWMPTTMAHASIGEALDIVSRQDQAFGGIPEVESVLGKLGRMDSPLDPAPISMFETFINYRSEYVSDKAGRRVNFRYDPEGVELVKDADDTLLTAPDGENYYVRGQFARDAHGRLIPDDGGWPFRQWRPALETELNEGRAAWAGIRSPDDIWAEIVQAGQIPGTTSAPKLQPIAARIVMLQSGMRAAMGVKVHGQSLAAVERFGLQLERLLKEVPSVDSSTVIADRIVAKPYLEIVPDRRAMDRYGVKMREFQDVVEIAIGGMPVTTTVEGRRRFPVRIRYGRELRDSAEALGRVLVPGMEGQQIPLGQIAEIRYEPGPQEIKIENTFLTGYVLFDMRPGQAEVDVVEQCRRYLDAKVKSGELVVPEGVSYTFAGSYENQLRSRKTLAAILPLAMFAIFMILYFQFKSVPTTLLVFSGIFVAWAGGFLLIWLYGQGWFLDFAVFGVNMRELFRVHPVNLSVAVWVGFLALFGIASDDGVIMATYLNQSFAARKPASLADVRQAVIAGGTRRIRPCLMTTATTILALLPVLTSAGRGSDIMIPMAIPSFGGMVIEIMTMLIVPVLYCALKERRLKAEQSSTAQAE